MATITGTNTEKTDQVTQLFLALRAQIRVMQWLGGILLPLVLAFVAWLVLALYTVRLEIATLQSELKAQEKTTSQRFDLMDKRFDQIDKALIKIEAKLDKMDDRLRKVEGAKGE